MAKLSNVIALTTTVAFAAFAGVGLAQADGMPGKRVAYEKPWDWGGLYFGVHSGYQWSSLNVQDPTPPPFGPLPSFGFDHDSMVVGGHIGLQHQFGAIVVGIEGSLTSAYWNNPGSTTCFAPGPQLVPGGLGNCSARLDDILTIGPRLGYAMGKWMPYITGGYANAAYHFYGRSIGTQIMNEEARARVGGWFIGGGVDMALSHGWTVGLDYRHYDFDDKIVAAHTPAGGFLEPARFHDATADIVTLRVSWKLGRDRCCEPLK
jgi:opacity protein-like surface antigen